MPTPPALPVSCSVAFKEWAGVCEALVAGRQAVILRKGGVAEDSGTFRPDHPAFWLYPTHVHESDQGLRAASPLTPRPPEGVVDLPGLAVVASVDYLDTLERLDALADLHIWNEETTHKRFHYRRPGLWAIGVRVFRLDTPRRIMVTAQQEGCKTWVPLSGPIATVGASPSLDDAAALAALAELARRIGPRTDLRAS